MIGDWVFFPADDTGKQRKLSRPWHGPYHVVSKNNINITATKVYLPDDRHIQFHQNRVQKCPMNFPAGYYWYGSKRPSPGRPPKWVELLLTDTNCPEQGASTDNTDMTQEVNNDMTSNECEDHSFSQAEEDITSSDVCEDHPLSQEVAAGIPSAEYDDSLISQAHPVIPIDQRPSLPTMIRTRTRTVKPPSRYIYK